MQHISTAILSALLTLFVTAEKQPQQVQSEQCYDICAESNEGPSDKNTLFIGKPAGINTPGHNHLPSFLAPIIAATKSYVLLTDNLPTGAGPGDVLRYTVNISNTGDMDADNVLFTDMIDINTTLVPGSLESSPILRNDSYSTVGNVSISVPAGTGLLANDTDLDGDIITVTAVNTAGTQGDVTFMANGAFTFNPAPGFTGTTTFEYTGFDGLFSRTATVTITVTNLIWFIDASAPGGGDGRLNTPFNSMNAFNSTAADDPGDNIFVYTGTYSNSVSTTLLANQKLIGQGAVGASLAALTGVTFSVHPPISPATIPAVNGVRPTINQAGNSIVLGNTNQVRGFNINNTSGTSLSGTTFGTFIGRQLTIANTGGIAINLMTGVLDVIVQSVSASGGTYGIRLGSTTGAFEITGSGAIDATGGTFSNISLRGIELINVTNITLRNINMNNANTADAGGDGVCDEDQNLACHAAIYMSNVTGTNLFNNVNINGTEEQGINGNGVTNLTLTNCTVTGAGNGLEENGLKFINLTGTCSFTGCTFSNSARRNTDIRNSSGNLNLNVQNCSFSNTVYDITRFDCFEMRTMSNATATVTLNNSNFHRAGSKGIQCFAEGNSTFSLNLTNSSVQHFGNPMAGVEVGSVGTATMNYNINNNTAIEARGEVAVLASTLNTSVINGRVNNNASITHNAPSASVFSNVRILQEGDGASRVEMRNNPSVSSTNLEIPVILLSRLGTNTNSRLDLTLDGNAISDVYAMGLEGVELRVGTSTSGTATNRICGNIINNSITLTTASRAFRARIIDPTGFMNLHGTGPVGNTWWTGLGNTLPPVGTIVGSATAPAAITFGNTCNTPAHAAPLAGDVVDALALDEEGESPLLEIYNPEVANDDGTADIPVITEPEVSFSMMAGETVIVGAPTGFNLPPAKDITIQFDVTVNDPFPLGVCSVSNQGSVSGSNFTTVLTDDPDVVGSADPTVTALEIAPTITTCPGNILTNTDLDECTALESFAAVAEGCPAPVLSYDIESTTITSPYSFPVGTSTVTVTASNGNLPNATCTFTVEVVDNQLPTITCPTDPINVGTDIDLCAYTVLGTEFNPTFSDNCPDATISNSFNGTSTLAGAELPEGSTIITWTVTDAGGNMDECTFTVVVTDDEPPSINCPPSETTPCDINDLPPYADLNAFNSAGGSVFDICEIDDNSFMYLGQTSVANVYTRTYQISDLEGNTASCTQTITVDDVTPPVITPGTVDACYPTVAELEAAAILTTSATDNCPGTLIKTATTTGLCDAVVTVTVTDAAGNTATTMYNSRVDNTPPVVTAGSINTCYPDLASAESAAFAATTGTDNCSGPLNKTVSTVGTCDAVITVTMTDGCGNSAFVTYNTSIDNEVPVIITGTIAACYPTVASAEAAAIAATSATDDCPSTLVYTATTTGTCTAIVTVVVSDACGNSSSTTYDTRIDNTPPMVTAGTIASCYPTVAAAEAAALAATTATDNCSGALTESVATVGDCSAVITVIITDGCGNSASVQYNTRIDNTAPVSTAGTISSCYPTAAAAEAAAIAATTATDNCPGTLTKTATTVGTCAAVITVMTTDECGNSSSVSYNTVIDNNPPVLNPGIINTCFPTVAAAEAAAIAATSVSDNCPGQVTLTASTAGDCSAVVTVTGTDFCGNSTIITYNTRIDNTSPVVTAGSIDACYNSVAAAEAAAIAATTATDNCPGILTYTAFVVGSCEAVITVIVSDDCDNTSSVIYNTRVDSEGPTIIPGTIAGCYPTQLAAENAALAITNAEDDCPSSLDFTVSTTGICDAAVTVTVTDGCNNSSSYTYYTRIDDTPPVAVCKNGTVYVNISGPYELLPSDVFDAGASSDNCPGPLTVVSITPATVDCDVLDQTISVEVIVRDSCGYMDTCIAMITVDEDNSIPAPWTHTSIGGAPGGAQAIPCLAEGTFEVSSTGFPSSTADKQNYLYQTICGDGEITVHVANIIGGGSAGVEFRETILPGSKRASLKTQLTSILRRQVRLVTNGAMQQGILIKPNPPSWLRMTRVGNVFTAYTSVNGTTWNFAFTATISMANCITVGMLSESINSSVNNQVWFDHVSVIGSNTQPRPFKGDIPEDMENQLLVELYPNPAQQWVMVATPELTDSKILKVTVFNALGNLLEHRQLAGGHTSLDITSWLPGVYWIKVDLDGKSVTKKLIKMH